MTYKDKISQQVDDMWAFLITTRSGDEGKGSRYCVKNRFGKNLRLDYEVSVNGEHNNAEDIMAYCDPQVPDQIKADLIEILEDGDVSLSSDPFLKVFDGIKKRGKQPLDFGISVASMYRQFKPSRDSVEYTVFMNVWVDWDEILPEEKWNRFAS